MIRYDDALPSFAALVRDVLGEDEVLKHAFLRDAVGRLTFIVIGVAVEETLLQAVRDGAQALAPWIDPLVPVATPEELFDPNLADPAASLPEFIDSRDFRGFVRLVERRVVGQDWLRPPADPIVGLPPIVVFASHKGGVGRSTALAVSSAALSRQGFNLLVVDLDLEAPGLGTMLLHESPRFGTLDYFVESAVEDVEDEFIDGLIGTSRLADRGLIHVAPAVGTQSESSPQNVLGKIARAYVERRCPDGKTESFLDRTRNLIKRLCFRESYDAVFIDSRAGLNEGTAAAILGLGAAILLFGVDTPQTFAGYRYFLAHLERFRPETSNEKDWRYRLRMVQAKAQARPTAQSNFRTSTFEMFSDTLYDLEEGIEEAAFNFNYDDVNAPHYAWPILDDTNYAEFNPMAQGDQFAKHFYDRTFGPFIAALSEMIGLKS